jgi:transcriptional regulator with XRE-family HTH domain
VGGDPVPIGRRVAYLRVRRRLSQQSFADRLGKSKSWVDKVERGVRSLERLSTIREIAAVLRVDPVALLGRDVQPAGVGECREGVARIRAALSAYPMAFCRPADQAVLSPDRSAREVWHAWMAYQYARYPRLVDVLPALVTEVHRVDGQDPAAGRAAVVEAYRVTAALLVKLGEGSLAWLAADRAMSAAAGDRVLLACAAVQLGQVLRASARTRPVLLAAASQITLDTPQESNSGCCEPWIGYGRRPAPAEQWASPAMTGPHRGLREMRAGPAAGPVAPPRPGWWLTSKPVRDVPPDRRRPGNRRPDAVRARIAAEHTLVTLAGLGKPVAVVVRH